MNLPMPVAMGIWIVIGALLIALVLVGLRRRRQDGTHVVASLEQIPDESNIGTALSEAEGIYVSTTNHGDWLRRIGAFGLGNRSHLILTAYDTGIAIERRGEQDFFIPSDRVVGHSRVSGIAGKYTPRGLSIITWRPPDTEELVDTGIRIVDRERREALEQALNTYPNTVTLKEHS